MYSQIESNKAKSFLLVIAFVVLVSFLAWFFSAMLGLGLTGFSISGILIIVFSVIGYYQSANIVLAVSGAREATRKEFSFLLNTVEGLAIAAGLPAPKTFVIDSDALNAFATGRDPEHSFVVVTTGLLKRMNRLELEGVLAHEMSHIKNYDIRLMAIVGVFVGVSVLLSDLILRSFFWGRAEDRNMNRLYIVLLVVGILLAILTPLIAQLMKLAVSRKREFLADASGAMLTRYPEGLASALEKIGKDTKQLATANHATAHLFISTPFKGTGSFVVSLFSTHPPIEERVKILRSMGH